MKEIIIQILNSAVNAPSGDNSQPWRFECNKQSITLYNLPKRDNEIFNYGQRGSYIAHGALIENITLLAGEKNLQTTITLFPDKNDISKIANIYLEPSLETKVDPLVHAISSRCTNRKIFNPDPLDPEVKDAFTHFKNNPSENLIFLENHLDKNAIAQAASIAEYTMLEYKPLHDAFFNFISWNKKEEQQRQIGMYIKTLELNMPQQFIFTLFKYWLADRLLSKLRLPKLIASSNAQIYASCAAIGGIFTPQENPENFIATGRMLQRIWLTVTKLGLSLQPIAGVIYLDKNLQAGGLPDMPKILQSKIHDAANTINTRFNYPEKNLSMLFRIGKGAVPTAKSSKLPAQITFV